MVETEKLKTPVVDSYLTDLELTGDDMAGKNILDLGAGAAMFASEARRMGYRVCSVDSDETVWLPIRNEMLTAKRRGLVSEELAHWRDVLASCCLTDMGKLPFVNESFDLVVSRYACPQALSTSQEVGLVLCEVVRVLKVGGEARFFPWKSERWPEEVKAMVVEALDFLAETKDVWVEVKKKDVKQPWGPVEKVELLTLRKFKPMGTNRFGISWAK